MKVNKDPPLQSQVMRLPSWTAQKRRKAQEEEVCQQISCSKGYLILYASAARMVKDYNWALTDTAGDAVPDQSNPRVIIVDELPEGDEVSHHN